MLSEISFVLDGMVTRVSFSRVADLTPTTTVLNFLRALPHHTGVKEGCAEGDCGACTVVLGNIGQDGHMVYRAVDSCLVFVPMIHGKHLVTVEDLQTDAGDLHPVQQAMVETGGSQCGYCTPGIIMSLFSLYKNSNHPDRAAIDDALTGNLCRCTGYRPIVEAAAKACVHEGSDHFSTSESKIAELLQKIPHESIHIKTGRQEYFRPVSFAEALALKRDHKDAVTICGATDVALRVTKRHELLTKVIDLTAVPELSVYTRNETGIALGAGMTLSDVIPIVKETFPALGNMLALFGSVQIRNLATLGGNLGTASPIGDLLPVFMAYNVELTLTSTSGSRQVSIHDFITGYRQTVKNPEELVTRVFIPYTPANVVVRSYKVSKRKDLDIATLSGGFRLQRNPRNNVVESIRLAYGGMADRVKRARSVEQFIIGKKWEREMVERAMELVDGEFTPISDARGSAEFRRVAARNLLLKFWSETRSEINAENGLLD